MNLKELVSITRRRGSLNQDFWLDLENLEVPEILPELLNLGQKSPDHWDILIVSEHFEPLWCYFDLLEELERGP